MDAIIYKASLAPMVVINSTLKIWCIIPEIDQITIIEDHGTIEQLSKRHGFSIISDSEWDLSPMIKKECTLVLENGQYRIVEYYN